MKLETKRSKKVKKLIEMHLYYQERLAFHSKTKVYGAIEKAVIDTCKKFKIHSKKTFYNNINKLT